MPVVQFNEQFTFLYRYHNCSSTVRLILNIMKCLKINQATKENLIAKQSSKNSLSKIMVMLFIYVFVKFIFMKAIFCSHYICVLRSHRNKINNK